MALRQRLLRDIAELQRVPYPYIQLIPSDDLTNACLVLTPPETGRLHLTIEFGNNYPINPPRISVQTYIHHSNVFGSYICASILNTEEGYTPAYDLKGICIQMLSFFASESIEQEYTGRKVSLATYRSLKTSIERSKMEMKAESTVTIAVIVALVLTEKVQLIDEV